MSIQRGAFDADAYAQQYSGALSAAANAQEQQLLSDPGPGSGGSGFDPDAENAVQRQNVSSQNVAPLPTPLQTSRAIGRLRPPQGAKTGGSGLSDQSSAGFYGPTRLSPDQQQSAQVYDYTDNAPEADVKAHVARHDNAISAGKDQHGHDSMESVWNATFQDELNKRSKQAMVDEDQASKLTKVSWRDKAAMFLDAANRATIIQSQNPMMSQGAAWAAGTRGALDGYTAHVQGMHDAYLQQQKQIREDAGKAATDHANLWKQGEMLRMKQEEDDEKKRHNLADEANNAAKNATEAAKEKREAGKDLKGDLVTTTDDEGKSHTGYIDPKTKKFTEATDASTGKPIGATKKTGTEAKPPSDTMSDKDAEAARDKSDADWEKQQSAAGGALGKVRGLTNPDGSKMTDAQITEAKKQFLKQRNPKAYKTLYGKDADVDLSAPPPKPGMTGPDDTPPSLRKK